MSNALARSSRKGEKPIVLIDVSGSMVEDARVGGRKIDEAFKALRGVEGRIISFGSECCIPSAAPKIKIHVEGGTPMKEALLQAGKETPSVVTLISDGHPTDGDNQAVFEAALAVGVPVNTVYIAEAYIFDLRDARDLLVAIAAATGGTFTEVGRTSTTPLHKELEQTFTTLALPARVGK